MPFGVLNILCHGSRSEAELTTGRLNSPSNSANRSVCDRDIEISSPRYFVKKLWITGRGSIFVCLHREI